MSVCVHARFCAPSLCLGYSSAEGKAAPSVAPVSQGSGRDGEYSAVLESARRAAAPVEETPGACRLSPLLVSAPLQVAL